ncbi:ATP-binding protein [Sphaerisporangium fuscum]|uniref:ATP-binding protein n=1 Tax=Sphaerisporangium fuscum TaxID=2835868 RepID=UPI001BDCD913|nr:tetratricopeptide repeat protein [Sphaerisporangium fuscum]
MVGFTGRDTELRWLIAAVSRAQGLMPVYTIDGMPGVGKTALVTRAAHMLAKAFPDGQLFVNLHAHTPGQQPADPREVLGDLLACTGMPQSEIPASTEGRAQRWRGRLAGRRVLLVLDDAANHAQVEPLLPGTAGCVVLVTSRRRLIAFDAEPLSLSTLPSGQALELFARVARRTPIGLEQDAVADLVERCGHLPLAITLLSGRLAHHPNWDIPTFANAFATAQDRMSELEAGDRAVTAAFDLSYRALSRDQQRFFRRLGLHPGSEIDAYAAAALNDISPDRARHQLDALYADHLIDEPALGRYRLHDLLHAYAGALVAQDPAEERENAVDRLCAYYQRAVELADSLIRHPRAGSTPLTDIPCVTPDLGSREQALTWMRTERSNLLSCTDATAISVPDSYVIRLAHAMRAFLAQEGAWDQAVVLHEAALSAARHSGDRLAEADALQNLSCARRGAGTYSAAGDLAEQALLLYRALGYRHGEANALLNLSHAQRLTGNYKVAGDLADQALVLYRSLGDRSGEAKALEAQAWFRRAIFGEYREAADLVDQALALYRTLGDRFGEAGALTNLRVVRHQLGEYSRAVDLAEQALALYRALGNRSGEADALRGLSRARCYLGNYEVAADLAEQALALYRSLGNRHSEAEALLILGRVRVMTRKFQAAADLAGKALALYQALEFSHGEANAIRLLGQARHLSGEHSAAADLLERARTLFRHFADDQGEAEVLNCMGALLADSAGPQEALVVYRQALALARKVQSPLDEAQALEGAAQCLTRSGQREAALVDLGSAIAIYKHIGAAEAVSAAERMAALEGSSQA